MKKYFYILSIAALGFTACESDYLETKPEDKIDKEVILGTTEYAELAINGMCRSMSKQYLGTQGLNGEGTILNWYGTFTGNDAQKSNQTGWSALWNSTYHQRTSSIYLYYPWFYYYKLVSNANAVIGSIDNAVGTDGDKAFIKAQALTFRAYSFFRLAQLYSFRWKDTQGNTPGIVLRVDESTGDIPLSTLAETYAQIYKDLDEAISLYQKSERDRDDFYQPGLDVAYAIYAKAALTREDWQTAANYAKLAREGHPLKASIRMVSIHQIMSGFGAYMMQRTKLFITIVSLHILEQILVLVYVATILLQSARNSSIRFLRPTLAAGCISFQQTKSMQNVMLQDVAPRHFMRVQ